MSSNIMSPKKDRGSHGHASGGSKLPQKTGVPMDMPPAGPTSQKKQGLPWTCLRRVKSLKKTRPWIENPMFETHSF